MQTISAASEAVGRGAFYYWFFFTWVCGLLVLPFGILVHFTGKPLTSLLPESWLVKHNSDSTPSLDVMENLTGYLFGLLQYSAFTLCGCIIVKHMLFGKKKPRRKKPADGAPAAAEENFSIANH